jgi:hypothetical protein
MLLTAFCSLPPDIDVRRSGAGEILDELESDLIWECPFAHMAGDL